MRSALLAALVTLLPAVAWAHPLVDEGQRLYQEADFEGALAAYARAEAADDLSREEALALLLGRAMVRFGLGQNDAMNEDLVRLAAVDPNHHLPAEVPPTVRQAFDAARAGIDRPLGLAVELQAAAGGARLTARLTGAGQELVSGLLARCVAGDEGRDTGSPEEQRATGEETLELQVAALPGSTVECTVTARGLGGAPLVTRGTDNAPLRLALPEPRPDPDLMLDTAPPPEPRRPWWPWAVAGGTAAIAVTVVVVVLATGGSSDTVVGGPGL